MHRLAFSVYPVEMVCGCLTKVVKDLNAEIASDRVSKPLSPGTLITRRVNPSYKEVMVLNFGDYVQAHVPATKQTTMNLGLLGVLLCTLPETDEVAGILCH